VIRSYRALEAMIYPECRVPVAHIVWHMVRSGTGDVSVPSHDLRRIHTASVRHTWISLKEST